MKLKTSIAVTLTVLFLAALVAAQDAGQLGFVISLKNGSSLRGRSLSRDDATGKLRLAMTESASGEAKTYAIIAPEDTSDIRSSASDTDSIRIRLRGGSEIRCKEFVLNGESVSVKLGSATKIDVRWSDIEQISFGQ